jgi:hypothetical protein
MLSSGNTDGRGIMGKVGDFGLSLKMDHMETHISQVYAGTMSHMAPGEEAPGGQQLGWLEQKKLQMTWHAAAAAATLTARAWPSSSGGPGVSGLPVVAMCAAASIRAGCGSCTADKLPSLLLLVLLLCWASDGDAEIMLEGRVSKAADVYAFGITMWELYTAMRAFDGVPRALLGHAITREHLRPRFPDGTPIGYRDLAERCWLPSWDQR